MKKTILCSQLIFFGLFAISALAQDSLKSDADINESWNMVYRDFNYDSVIDSYRSVLEVETFGEDIDKAKCEKNYSGLQAGAKKIPVSISLNYWTYRCASALDRKSDEEQYLQHFSLLAKNAFGQASDFRLAKPIRVLHSSDIFALVDASGNVLLDQYFDLDRFGRHLPWVVVLLDKETKRQRSYTFDFLDLISRTSEAKNGEFRAFRVSLSRELIKNYKEQDWLVGVDAQAVLDAVSINSKAGQLEVLKPLALKGYKNASDLMLATCIREKDNDCGQFMVDAMLDSLEQKDTEAMIRMAALYSAGVGVKQDADAAFALMKSAEKLTGDNGSALRHFVTLHDSKQSVLGMPPKVQQFLETEAFKKNKPMLLYPYIYMQVTASDLNKVLARYGDRLGVAANDGNIDIYNLYSASFIIKGNKAEQIKWLEAAAKNGSARAQMNWAKYLLGKDPSAETKAAEWMLEAAKNGELEAMQWLVNYYYDKQQLINAAGWAESGLNFSDLRSGLQLAYIYALEPEGSGFTEAGAIKVLEAMSSEHDSANARALWAGLLMRGKTVKHNTAKAKALLLQDAMKNDVDSMGLLGMSLMNGDIEPKEVKAGLSWLEKAANLGSKNAKRNLAEYLYSLNATAEDMTRAKKLWSELAVKNSPSNINTYAWTLCTSTYPGYADAKTGLSLMQLLDEKDLPIAQRDTYAACLAANSDFKQAVVQQQRVVDELGKRPKSDEKTLLAMKQRLAMYQKSQIYTEAPAAR